MAILAVAGARPSVPRPAEAGNVRADADPYPGIEPNGCRFLPDPSSPAVFLCGSDNNPTRDYAFVGAPMRLDLAVADPNGDNMTVTIAFDAAVNSTDNSPELGNLSAVTVLEVTSPGPDLPVNLTLNWTYDHLSETYPIAANSSYFLVWVRVNDTLGNDSYVNFGCPELATSRYGQCLFMVAAAINSAPSFTEGLATSWSGTVTFPDPVVPSFSQYVVVQDNDNDPLTATWDWGDGSETNQTFSGDTMDGVTIWGNHTYVLDTNTTPRDYLFYLNLTVTDGIPGHRSRQNADVSYHVNFDDAPGLATLMVSKATWLVGETVRAASSYSDGDSDNVTYHWDFGDGTSTAPVTVSASPSPTGVNATHAYASPGNYTIRLWATDGAGKCVWGGTACIASHLVNASAAVEILGNRAPTVSLSLSTPPQYTGRPAGFTVALYDPDGDPLNLTWDFGDGTWLTNYTNATSDAVHALSRSVQVFQNHTYLKPGPPPSYNYTVQVWGDDGHGHNVSSSTVVFVGSTNLPPIVLPHLELTNSTVLVGETFTLDVNVTDPEGDPANVTVDWGDRSTLSWWLADLTPEKNSTVVSFIHTYRVPGAWQINVSATDYQVFVMRSANGTLLTMNHTVVVPVSITVQPIPVPVPPDDWTWVDYTTLGAVLAVPIGFGGRAAYRRREERREE